MKDLTCVRYMLVSILLATFCLGCKSTSSTSTTEEQQQKKMQDYFGLYQTDLDLYNLKGRVKGIIDTTYYATIKFGEVVKTSIKECSTKTFDEKGRLLKCSTYDNANDHRYDSNYDYKYVETDSTLIKESYRNGEFKGRDISLYDTDGRIIKTEMFNNKNHLIYLFAYTYNDHKLLQDYTIYGEDGNIVTKRYDMQYDLNDCLIHYKFGRGESLKWGNSIEITYDENQHIVSEKTYVFNSQETALHQDNGNIEQSTEHVVDIESGNLIFSTNKEYGTYLGDIVVEKEEQLKYRYEGDWYEKIVTKYSPFTYTTSFIQKQELTYDEYDNYTTSILYTDEIPVEITLRHIEYYK